MSEVGGAIQRVNCMEAMDQASSMCKMDTRRIIGILYLSCRTSDKMRQHGYTFVY